jgi:hypothetical protein
VLNLGIYRMDSYVVDITGFLSSITDDDHHAFGKHNALFQRNLPTLIVQRGIENYATPTNRIGMNGFAFLYGKAMPRNIDLKIGRNLESRDQAHHRVMCDRAIAADRQLIEAVLTSILAYQFVGRRSGLRETMC